MTYSLYVVVSPWDADQHVHGEEEVEAAEEKVEIWNGVRTQQKGFVPFSYSSTKLVPTLTISIIPV
jgi:hypothetical protein